MLRKVVLHWEKAKSTIPSFTDRGFNGLEREESTAVFQDTLICKAPKKCIEGDRVMKQFAESDPTVDLTVTASQPQP